MKKDKSYYLLEYMNIVKPILEHPEFQRRKYYPHHGQESVYEHSIKVSILAYYLARKFHLNKKDAAIAGLLHDFYYRPWQNNSQKKKFLKQHGFVHANEALENSRTYFNNLLNKQIENAIERHMFPLNKVPPKYSTGWLVTLADKYVSLSVFKHPTKLYKYVGLANLKKKVIK